MGVVVAVDPHRRKALTRHAKEVGATQSLDPHADALLLKLAT